MNKKIRETIIEKVGKELNKNGFFLIDLGYKNILHFRRKTNSYIEIIQFSKDKYNTCFSVASSLIFYDEKIERNTLSNKEILNRMNLNYLFLKEYCNGDIEKMSIDECGGCRYDLKGNIGNNFHYGDVYWDFSLGIVGVSPQKNKKPTGLRIKKFTDKTYDELCDCIISRLPKIYFWLEKQKNTHKKLHYFR